MIEHEKVSIAIIGLGYVGLPLSVEFSKKYPVVGYDLNIKRIKELNDGYDRTGEIDFSDLKKLKTLKISSNKKSIENANVYIVTVPTPVDKNNIPNLNPLKNASEMIGSFLKKNDIVIYESTVYPGATEEICVPILEMESHLKYNRDFFCGYSPERINPGDKKNKLTSIKKVTSGSNKKTAKFIQNLYKTIIKAGVYPASSIAVAEAAKVIENTQRDVNIALINELALIFNKMGIDTQEVLTAAQTKWNFLPFQPGLVGGHCIGVDPYYLTHKAAEIGHHPEMILAGRKVNDSMGKFIAEQTILKLIKNNITLPKAKIGILGLTFKENCPDIRNTKVIDIVHHLKKYKCNLYISDEYADPIEVFEEHNIRLVQLSDIENCDAIIIAVPHIQYINFSDGDWNKFLTKKGLIIDVKSIYDLNRFFKTNFIHWRL